jgi:hypothetical protein
MLSSVGIQVVRLTKNTNLLFFSLILQLSGNLVITCLPNFWKQLIKTSCSILEEVTMDNNYYHQTLEVAVIVITHRLLAAYTMLYDNVPTKFEQKIFEFFLERNLKGV